MQKWLLAIYQFFEKRRPAIFAIFGICLGIFLFFGSRIRLEEDISKILPRDGKTDRMGRIFQESKFIDKLVITVSLKDTVAVEPDSLLNFADFFVARLKDQAGPYIQKINYRADEDLALHMLETIWNNLPIYLSEKDYSHIDSVLTPGMIRQTLTKNIHILGSPAGVGLKNLIIHDPLGISLPAIRKMQQLQYDENFELYDNAVLTKDKKHLLIFITPAYPANNTGKNAAMLRGIEQAAEQCLRAGFRNTEVSYFGSAAVAAGNATQLRKDTILTLSITLGFLLIFLGWYFRKKRAPLVILIPVVFGAAFSLMMIYFIRGAISVIALGTGSVILGIAVNYSLHVYNHFRHTRKMEDVIHDLTLPLTIGSLTTIGGFFCLEFVKSEMLKDLGLFAAFSLIGASLCSLIFLPHFIAAGNRPSLARGREDSWINRIAIWRPENNKLFILLLFVLSGIFLYCTRWVGFDADLNSMNYMSPRLQEAEQKLNRINAYSLKSVYLIAEGRTLEDALKVNEQMIRKLDSLRERNLVNKYSGVSSLIISDSLQQQRISYWNHYWNPQRMQELQSNLIREGLALGFRASAFDEFQSLLNKAYQPVRPETMAAIYGSLVDDFITTNPDGSRVVTLAKLTPENKSRIYHVFDHNPSLTVLDRQYLTEKFLNIINSDFTRIAWMTSILVFSVLLLSYGRIELTLVSFIPMFIAWIWILGIMGIAGIRFNIINIILSALIFGLGDDYSLFIMDGLLQEYKTGKKNLGSYKSSIVLSALTTLAGLGVLVFARHPALRSIAWISIIGMSCVVLIAQTLIPFLFSLLIGQRASHRQFPWTLGSLLLSLFAFLYYTLGCLLVSFCGIFLVRLNPFNKEKGKWVYHVILAFYARTVIYIMGNVKKKIINPLGEDFKTPCVVICNHQSFLDILLTAMLNPRLILLTNQWVWRSPVFGFLVRMADYYPVAQGIENSLDLLKDRVEKGYSIVVFPEGTRSKDGHIKRFHKGAFYLAEKLGLDILPVLIHGTGYTMSRGDFMLKNGRLTMEFLPRIKPDDPRFGTTYSLRARQIGQYFRESYALLKTREESPSYFREKLIYNYLYKGPVLEWYLRVKLRLEKNYQPFHELLPRKGRFLDIGCGYGFMAYMLHWSSAQREFIGIDHDEEKIEVARHCFGTDEAIRFLCADIRDIEIEKFDGIILSDLLHYLDPESQRRLIEKCMASLNEEGVIIIREGNKDLRQKHRGTKLTEFFSTRLLGFNKTSGNGLSFISGSLIREMAGIHHMTCRVIDDTRYTSNMIFELRREQQLVP